MRRMIASTMAVLVFLAPFELLAAESESAPQRTMVITKAPDHSGLGLGIGLTLGILLGGYAASEMTDDGGAFFMLWSAFAAGGAVAGYAAGGGFSKREWGEIVEEDAAQEQARLREAEQARRAELLAKLTLSPMPELDFEPLPLSSYTTTSARLGSWSGVAPTALASAPATAENR